MLRTICALWLICLATAGQAAVEIKEVTSPGGINAWLVEEPSIPFAALEIRFRGGASLEPAAQRGATNLMMALIEEGAGDMTAREFQTKREELAASFRFRAGDDIMSVSAEFLSENRSEALALLREALINPRFDDDAIERVRAQVISGIESDAKRPNRIAGAAFNAAAFPGHPYGSSMDGTLETVSALTRDDLIAAHQATLTRDRVYVGAVGDITAEELGPILDALLGDLPATGPSEPPNIDFALDGGVTVIDYATPQAVALFGHAGIERDHPDYMAAYILNEYLGGSGRESRLMHEVREKRGLTYGIGSSLVPRFHANMVIGQVASANATIAEAIAVTRDEWARVAQEGMTQEELDAFKTYMSGEYPLRFDGNSEIASILVGMQIVGLSPDYVFNRNDILNAVTLEDVNRVARELLQPEDLHFVVVGQPEGLDMAN